MFLPCKRILLFLLACSAFSFGAAWLGISFKSEPYQKQVALKILGIHPSSGAVGKDVSPGDKIIGVNGKKITDMGVVKSELSNLPVGKTVTLELVRNGKTFSVKVAMTERPDDISSLTGSSIGNKAVAFEKNFYKNGEKRKKKPKVTILDFWATWCGPCRMTLPILGRLYEKLESRGLEVIGVSSETESVLEKFYGEHPSPYPLYRDATQEMWRRYGISAVPTLMLLDENGYIQKVWPGAPNERAIEKAVLEAMK
jgi:thiol-disulfide isomerase/thioredoxin